MPLPTPEFLESLGRLVFEFAALAQMVGLRALELDPSQNTRAMWSLPFGRKLTRLKKALLKKQSWKVQESILDDLLKDAEAVATKRNTIIHGVLQFHPNGDVLLKNLQFGEIHPVESIAVDAMAVEVAVLYDHFVNLRGGIAARRLRDEAAHSGSAHS